MGIKAQKKLKAKSKMVAKMFEEKGEVTLKEISEKVYGVGKPGVSTKKKCRRLMEYIKKGK